MVNLTKGSIYILLIIIISSGCKKEIIPEEYYPTETHEQYIYALEKLGLNTTALGQEWITASKNALSHPISIKSPYQETLYMDPALTDYVGYRISAKKGQKIEITLTPTSDKRIKTFLDIFRVDSPNPNLYTKIASSNVFSTQLIFEPKIDSDYIIRYQTELLRGGSFDISIITSSSLSFPVKEGHNRDIGSFFGDPRDGGKRKHHGIDIFAKRHTPIVAPADGYINYAGERGLGGTVIWMKDDVRGQTLYFAHLQELMVNQGEYVTKGDTIGTVGNTGNARTTPPHLHFGIYQNRPVDPYHFVANTKQKPSKLIVDPKSIGQWIRVKTPTHLNNSNLPEGTNSIAVHQNQILYVLGVTTSYYRVILPDQTMSYIHQKYVEPTSKSIKKLTTEKDLILFNKPNKNGIIKNKISLGHEVNLLGVANDFYLIEDENNNQGWVKKAAI